MTGVNYKADSPNIINLPWVSSVTQYGITWNFAEPRPVGQYANGDWWVVGPVSFTSITPVSQLYSGSTASQSYVNRQINGTMVNPGNRSFASGGLTTNNGGGAPQGWDSLVDLVPNGGVNWPYLAANNVDPGATGLPLNVTTGSVVKAISRTDFSGGLPPHLTDMAVLTVVDEVPPPDALRPGIAWTNKRHVFRMKHFSLGMFQNNPLPASAPNPDTLAASMTRMVECSIPDSINSRSVHALNNHPEYGREIAKLVSDAALLLHCAITEGQKLTLLLCLAQIGIDCWARAFEGGIAPGYGGGQTWKKAPLVLAAIALGNKAAATSMVDYANRQTNFCFGEDRHIFRVSALDVNTPRNTADGRPRTAFSRYMVGSAEWSESPISQPDRSASNWDAFYRDVAWGTFMGSALAVQMTAGAQALWNNDDLFLYTDTAWDRYSEFQAPTNAPSTFHVAMFNSYKVPPAGAPTQISGEVKGTAIGVLFNQALKELIAAPATTDFVVKVNGSPVSLTGSVQVWRQSVGLTLVSAVTGNDVVTVDYVPGTNKITSTYGVPASGFTGLALTNRTDKVGGPNPVYPVVRFSADTRFRIISPARIASTDSSTLTLALLKFRFTSLPAATAEIFGNSSGSPPLRLFLTPAGSFEVRIANSGGTTIGRFTIPGLSTNTDYDILVSVDLTQTTAANGANAYVNGVAQTLGFTTWSGGAGVVGAWTRALSTPTFNFSGMQFDIGAIYINTATRVDLTVSGNRSKFTSVTSGNLDILTLGDGISGSQPSMFLVGNADQWNSAEGINRGTGSKVSYLSGTQLTLISGSEWI